MLRTALLLLIIASFSSSLLATVSASEYQENYDKCWKMLLSQDCNRQLLTKEDLHKIENKYSRPEPARSNQRPTGTLAPTNQSESKLRRGEVVNITREPAYRLPDNSAYNARNNHEIRFFRRGEVPDDYEGDYIVIDQPNPAPISNTNNYQSNKTSVYQDRRSTNYLGENNYATPRQTTGTQADITSYRASPPPTAYQTTPYQSDQEAATDAAIKGALGVIIISLVIFVAGWILRTLIGGIKRLVGVTASIPNARNDEVTNFEASQKDGGEEFSPMKGYVALLSIMTFVGLAPLPYPYFILLRLGFIIAFVIAIGEAKRINHQYQTNIVWPYVGLGIFLFAWGLPHLLWFAIDFAFLVLFYRMYWGLTEMTTERPDRT